MVKKKYLIFFVMLLVVLLLGLSASCYAFSKEDIQNLAYTRLCVKFNESESFSITNSLNINRVPNSNSTYEDISNYFNNDSYKLIALGQSNLGDINFYFIPSSDFGHGIISYTEDTYKFTINRNNIKYLKCFMSSDSTSGLKWYTDVTNNVNENIYIGWIYTEDDIYNVNHTSKIFNSETSRPNTWTVDNGPYESGSFAFREVSTNVHVKIGSDGVSMPLYYAPGSSLYFADFINDDGRGQINLDKLITGDALYMTYYIGNGSWAGRVKFFERDFGSNIFTDNRYINYTKSSITDTKFSLNGSYIYTNVVYDYQIFYTEDGVSKFLNYYFYIGDSTTTIVDNIIDPGDSIPDLNNYLNTIGRLNDTINNNDNNDNIVDTISSGDNAIIDTILGTDGVDETLHDWASGDVESTASKLGFQNLANPYSIVIFGFVNDVIETLQSSGDVYFDYSLHGETPTRIHSSDIYLPNGKLKTFIRLVLVFITIYFIYNRFRILVDQLSTADVKGTIENTDVDVNYFYM